MLLGDPRQSDQRTQSFHFPIVVHHSALLLNRALKRQALILFTMHFEVRALDRLRTRRRVGSARRRGNHMHDHSRFQRDINDVTGVLSLSLSLSPVSLSQKSLTHNIGSASALPIISLTFLCPSSAPANDRPSLPAYNRHLFGTFFSLCVVDFVFDVLSVCHCHIPMRNDGSLAAQLIRFCIVFFEVE